MEDAEHGDALLLLGLDEVHHDRAVLRIERSCRLIEQQYRMIGDEAASDIHALLFAAREGRRRQGPQPFRKIELRQKFAGAVERCLTVDATRNQRFGNHIDCRNARQRAQKLADIADRIAAHRQHFTRIGSGKIDKPVGMADHDRAAIDRVIAIDHLQDRAFARARRPAKHGAFTGIQFEIHAANDRKFDAALQMHDEGLGNAGDGKRG